MAHTSSLSIHFSERSPHSFPYFIITWFQQTIRCFHRCIEICHSRGALLEPSTHCLFQQEITTVATTFLHLRPRNIHCNVRSQEMEILPPRLLLLYNHRPPELSANAWLILFELSKLLSCPPFLRKNSWTIMPFPLFPPKFQFLFFFRFFTPRSAPTRCL